LREDWSSHGQPFKLTKKNGGDGAGQEKREKRKRRYEN